MSSAFNTWIGWPLLLACGWTWCIGMYLPVLLLDRFGWPALFAFTIPNVLGVILFGRFMKSVAQSRAFVRRYQPLLVGFSLVTIAFHVFFLSWIWAYEFNCDTYVSLIPSIIIVIFAYLLRVLSDQYMRWFAFVVYLISLTLMSLTIIQVMFLHGSDGTIIYRTSKETFTDENSFQWMFAALPMLFGFLLCPYADLSFHRAYQKVGGGQAGASTFLMFGFFFLIMVVFTVIYGFYGFNKWIAMHLVVQSLFTITLHLREMDKAGIPQSISGKLKLQSLIWLAVPMALFVSYQNWLAFYGLICPAIILLTSCRRFYGYKPISTLAVLIFIILAIPFNYYGFQPGNGWLLSIPLVILLFWFFTGSRRVPVVAAS